MTASTAPARRAARRLLLVLLTGALALTLGGSALAQGSTGATTARATGSSRYVPPIRHVFVINIENTSYSRLWDHPKHARYLAGRLRHKGVLLYDYYGTAHESLGNYLAQISGQGPDPEIQGDCQVYRDFDSVGTVSPGQYVGTGCVFPKRTGTIVRQLDRAGYTWRGYMQDMGRSCRHPELGTKDGTQTATKHDMYAARHDPFMYFHSIIDRRRYCKRHVVDLRHLRADLHHVRTTRNLSYITPDLCSDGHDTPCADGRHGGLRAVNAWMRRWVPRILHSPAYKRNGALVITADESDGPESDSSSCCNEQAGPNTPQPGITGMGGGRIGALVLSRWTRGNTWSTTPYNHYALLASLEDVFRLHHLGYARTAGLDRFGLDVWNRYRR
jgi:hypothetical protein